VVARPRSGALPRSRSRITLPALPHRMSRAAWVARRLLNPASAMFREGHVLLSEAGPTARSPTR